MSPDDAGMPEFPDRAVPGLGAPCTQHVQLWGPGDIMGHEGVTPLLPPPVPRSPFSLAGPLPVARELSFSELSLGSTPLASAKRHRSSWLGPAAPWPAASRETRGTGLETCGVWGRMPRDLPVEKDPGAKHSAWLCVSLCLCPLPIFLVLHGGQREATHVASTVDVNPSHSPPKGQQESRCQGAQPLRKAPVVQEQGQAGPRQHARHREEAGPRGESQAVRGVTQLQAWADTDGLRPRPLGRAALSRAVGISRWPAQGLDI